MTWNIINADSLEILKKIEPCSIDSVVCDPPAGISFMNQKWDSDKGGRDAWIDWLANIMREALRVLKPGGYAVVWSLPRTSHWTGMACENAGFENREFVSHFFGSGFPKNMNVAKAIDKALGSSTEEAKQWSGWGTAIKPAHEVWWICRKPLEGTLAKTLLTHGTGAINVDGCRVHTDWDEPDRPASWKASGHTAKPEAEKIAAPPGNGITCHPGGRWPANVVLTHSAECTEMICAPDCPSHELKKHGADRYFNSFFYTSKPSTREREAGCEALPIHTAGELTDRKPNSAGLNCQRAGAGRTTAGGRRNNHPTVKPIELMRWLVRLVTPPGGTVLDPFAGSGTTGVAAVLEGFNFLGIEIDAHFCEIARARIEYHQVYQPALLK